MTRTSLLRTVALCLVALCFAAAGTAEPPTPRILGAETVALFDPLAPENPEGIAIDKSGNAFISMAATGEIHKLTPDGVHTVHAVVPIRPELAPCFGFGAVLGPLTIDARDRLYATVNSCNAAERGVWRIDPDGSTRQIARVPTTALINGIELVGPNLYIADSRLGLIWTVPAAGGTPTVWIDDPTLKDVPTVFAPGPNGLQFYGGEIYVANSSTARILAIRLGPHGEAGALREHAVLPFGCDDFAFDARGNLYCTTDPANRLILVRPDGSSEIILDDIDLLDGPTDAAFGRVGRDRFSLYVTNAAFPIFTVTNRPSLLRLDLDVPGAPD